MKKHQLYKMRAQKFASAFTPEGWRFIGSFSMGTKSYFTLRRGTHQLTILANDNGITIYRDGKQVKHET